MARRCRPVRPDRPRKRGAFSPSDALLLAPDRGRSTAELLQQPGCPVACPGHKKPAPGWFRNLVPRSFDEPQRLHGAALPVRPDRPPVNAGRFLLQMLSCWRRIGVGEYRGAPSAVRGRPLPFTQKAGARYRFRNPVARSFDEPQRLHGAALPVWY
jgi:hypothetical protein